MSGTARVLGGVAAGIGAVVLVLYLALIIDEGDDSFFEVAPWALAMATASGLAAAGTAATRRRLGARLLLVAGAIFMVVGLPGIFSVGFPLIVAGILSVVASGRADG